jgi:hypothetical protein
VYSVFRATPPSIGFAQLSSLAEAGAGTGISSTPPEPGVETIFNTNTPSFTGIATGTRGASTATPSSIASKAYSLLDKFENVYADCYFSPPFFSLPTFFYFVGGAESVKASTFFMLGGVLLASLASI